MKKILALMLILVTVFSFVSCGCQEDPPEEEQQENGDLPVENGFPLVPIKPINPVS